MHVHVHVATGYWRRSIGLQLHSPSVAASLLYGCSLCHTQLQPLLPTAAAFCYLRLQPLLPTAAACHTTVAGDLRVAKCVSLLRVEVQELRGLHTEAPSHYRWVDEATVRRTQPQPSPTPTPTPSLSPSPSPPPYPSP